jgi:hypothetical protein
MWLGWDGAGTETLCGIKTGMCGEIRCGTGTTPPHPPLSPTLSGAVGCKIYPSCSPPLPRTFYAQYISDDYELECDGKESGKCASRIKGFLDKY